jgi:hypothetical protein
MLIPQIKNKYYFETVILHGRNSERNENAFYWKAGSLKILSK